MVQASKGAATGIALFVILSGMIIAALGGAPAIGGFANILVGLVALGMGLGTLSFKGLKGVEGVGAMAVSLSALVLGVTLLTTAFNIGVGVIPDWSAWLAALGLVLVNVHWFMKLVKR